MKQHSFFQIIGICLVTAVLPACSKKAEQPKTETQANSVVNETAKDATDTIDASVETATQNLPEESVDASQVESSDAEAQAAEIQEAEAVNEDFVDASAAPQTASESTSEIVQNTQEDGICVDENDQEIPCS